MIPQSWSEPQYFHITQHLIVGAATRLRVAAL